MARIDDGSLERSNRIPAPADGSASLGIDKRWRWQVARKRATFIQDQRYTVIGMSRRTDDRTGNANTRQECPTAVDGQLQVVMQRDVDIRHARFHKRLEPRDRLALWLQYDQADTARFELLVQTGVIRVIL